MEIIINYYIKAKKEKYINKKLISKIINKEKYINIKKNYLILHNADNKIKNKSEKNIYVNNNFRKLLSIIIILMIIPICLPNEIELRKLISNYEISIKIKGTGNQYILSDTCQIEGESYSFNNLPNEIIINDISKNDIMKLYYLDREINTIKMTWNSGITSFKALF